MVTVKGGEPKTINIEDGLHTGKIKALDERQVEGKDYSYLDIFLTVIESEKEETEIKVGFPLPKTGEGLNEKMQLGKLVERFTGKSIEPGKDYDLDKIITGDISFQTVQNEKGYAEVMKQTLKPYKK